MKAKKKDSRFIETSLRKAVVVHARAAKGEVQKLRKTPSGRVVAASFKGDDGRLTNIYMDEVARFGEDDGRIFVRPLPKPPSDRIGMAARSSRGRGRETVTVHMKMSYQSRQVIREDVILDPESRPFPASLKKFAVHFLVNIRKQVCSGRGNNAKLNPASSATIGGLATWIMSNFGSTPAAAKAMAAALLILLAGATKGAFCDMTEEMAKKVIKQAKSSAEPYDPRAWLQ